MNTFGKVCVFVLLVLSIGFATSQMLLYARRTDYYELWDQANTQLNNAKAELERTSNELDDKTLAYDTAVSSLGGKVENLEARVDDQQQDIADLQAEKASLNDRVDKMTIAIEKQSEALQLKEKQIANREERVESLNAKLNEKVTELNEKTAELRDRSKEIEKLQDVIAELRDEFNNVREERDRSTALLSRLIEIGFHLPGEELVAIDAKVVRVDPQYGLAVINRGRKDGVKLNYSFTVYREDQFVAKVVVYEVEDQVAAARVQPGLLAEGQQIEIGDDATTRIR